MVRFIKDVFNFYLDNNTLQKGAALAYYTVFSLLPIIIIITSLLGIFFGEQAVSGEIYTQLKDIIGTDASLQIQNIIKSQKTNNNGLITSIIGFVVLVFSASGMLSQVHNSFNAIWSIKEQPKSSILKFFTKRLLSFIILIILFLLIFISTIFNSFLIKYSHHLNGDYNNSYLYEHLLSFLVMSITYSIMFKFLSDAKIHWKAVLLGGLFTAFLFSFGKIGFSFYITHSNISSTFGSASALAILMLWVYYISQIIFLGASFVKIISTRMGFDIVPNSNAIKIEKIEVD